MDYFKEEEKLLLIEGELTDTMLLLGLDCLRRANIYQKGLYYQAFYSLGVGIERLLKLIIITKYRVDNGGDFPDNSYVRKYGHDIYKMIEQVKPDLLEDDVSCLVIKFLSDFSKTTRYYNLDSITGCGINKLNPLSEWKKIEEVIISKYVRKKKEIMNKNELASMLDGVMNINFFDMDCNTINSSIDILDEIENRDLIQGYNVLVIFKIIRSLVSDLSILEHKHYYFPYLWEIFRYFLGEFTDSQIRYRKNWRSFINC